MDYYDSKENVEEYIRMAESYDGRQLIETLQRYLPPHSTVLELGLGPGKDLELLAQSYIVTGSDKSNIFLQRYQSSHPLAELLQLDAISLETNRRFQALYSNKTLQHLSREELTLSLQRQLEVLHVGGFAVHSLWYGVGEENVAGCKFSYYTEDEIKEILPEAYRLVEIYRYKEMEDDDSLCIVLQRLA